jgi:integrase
LHRLTVTKIRAAGPGWHHDGGGLYVFKSTKETGSWVYRWAGKNMGLGSTALVDLTQARERARECRALRAAGFDPREKRNAERLEAQIAVARTTTFSEATARYIAAHKAGWRNRKHQDQWGSTLTRYASPVIGQLPCSRIDVALVMQILEPLWTAKPETARRVRNRIELILDWAKVRGYRDGDNPARWRGHLDKLLPKPSKVRKIQHHAALNYAELPAFMQELRAQEGVWARALEFTILTAARGGEVRGAVLGEIDLAAKVWTVPAERMKSGKDHRVPLSRRASQSSQSGWRQPEPTV